MRKPLTGTILGVVLGWAIAVILQQNGVWPPDRLTIWLLPALLGLLVMWLLSIGKEGSVGTFVVSLVVFDDYPWKNWVEIGRFPVTIDSEKSENNAGGSEINGGDVANVTEYAKARDIPIDQIRGVVKVGGDAANTCDGFGLVKLTSDPFETLVSQIAAALVIIVLIFIAVIMILSRGTGGAAVAATATAARPSDAGDGGGADDLDAEQDSDVDGEEKPDDVEG